MIRHRKSIRGVKVAGAPEDAPALLVFVHPGSLCGSFWINGGSPAEFAALAAEVAAWPGQIITLDNDLTAEIAVTPTVRRLYQRASFHLPASGEPRDLVRAARFVATLAYPARAKIVVTGLWVGRHGCVTCFTSALRRIYRPTVTISPHAILE